jgi:CheY-like chemotaxis protein
MSINITNVLVKPMNVTWGASSLGLTEGDVEITFVEDIVDVTGHQEGTNVLSGIRTGKRAEVSVTLKQTNRALVKYMLEQSGQSVTAASGASAVVGWGSGRDFTQTLGQAQALKFHPVTKASADYSEDITFWKAYPKPDSFVFSGENPSTLSIEFHIYPDSSKAKQARLGVVGDSTTGNFATVT